MSIILTHNYPSEVQNQARQMKCLRKKIKEAAGYLDIRVLDHIIVSDEGYYSFSDEGKM